MIMKKGNIFKLIPKKMDDEAFESLIKTHDLTIERIISKGHTSPASGWYCQNHHEWVIVLQGAATIALENNEKINMAKGDYLNISAHTKHKVTWTHPDIETIWLAIHYHDK